jgi:hypothetical protein
VDPVAINLRRVTGRAVVAKQEIPLSNKNQEWINAKKKYRLSDIHIQMARELGMNPKKFGSIANHKQEKWKAPLPDFIENLYYNRFRKEKPDVIVKLT